MSATANHMDMLVDEAGHDLETFGIENVDIEPVGQLQVTSDVDDLLLKVIDAPTKKEKRKADREAR